MPLTDIDTNLEREDLEHLAGSPGFEDLTFTSALEIRARDIMNETVMALSQAQESSTPPKAKLPKIPVRRHLFHELPRSNKFQSVHIASQGSPFRRSNALAPLAPRSAMQSPADAYKVVTRFLAFSVKHKLTSSQNAQVKQEPVDYRIDPVASLPTAAACKNLSLQDRATVLERKKHHFNFLLDERERLERAHQSIKAQMKRLPMELNNLQAEIEQMTKEDDVFESSDEDWLYKESKASVKREAKNA